MNNPKTREVTAPVFTQPAVPLVEVMRLLVAISGNENDPLNGPPRFQWRLTIFDNASGIAHDVEMLEP